MKRPLIAALLIAAAPGGMAQPAVAPAIGGIVQFNEGAADLVKSERFYHDVLGLESGDGDPRMRLDWYAFGPRLADLYATQGRVRNFALRVPGAEMAFEPLQWSEATGKPARTRIHDPGAGFIVLDTWNIDAATERLRQGRAQILTRGRKPVRLNAADGSYRRVLWVRDPDGLFVQLVQPDPPSIATNVNGAPPGSYYTGLHAGFVVADLEATLRFYRDALGFTAEVGGWTADPRRLAAFGLARGEFRTATLRKPESRTALHLIEFKGLERQVQRRSVIDSGAGVIRVRVQGIDALVGPLTAAGARVVSSSGAPTAPPGARMIMLEGPDNIFVQLVEASPPR